MAQNPVDSIGIAVVIFVMLICPLLLFIHTLGSRWRGVGWASAWLGLSFIPILLVVVLLARTASHWVELSALILCIPLTGVAGLLCRGAPSRAAKALRLQRWFIVGALVALGGILVDKCDKFAVLAMPYAAAYCNLLSLVMLVLGCGLRIVARPIVRRGRARGVIRAKRRLRRLMPELYAVGCAAAILFLLGMSAREHVEWNEYGDHILTEQQPGVLHFSGGSGTQAHTGILPEHISSTESGQNARYRLPESDYRKLLNWVRRVSDGGFSTEAAPSVPHSMQP